MFTKDENIQESALRFIYKDHVSTYKELLTKGNHIMLYISRIRIIATEAYKAFNELSPKYLQDIIEKSNCDYNLRSSSHLTQPKCNTVSYGLISFRYNGPKMWNSLPNYIKKAISLSEFKFLIKSWDGPKCLCNLCQTMLSITFVHIIYIIIQMSILKLVCLCLYMRLWI